MVIIRTVGRAGRVGVLKYVTVELLNSLLEVGQWREDDDLCCEELQDKCTDVLAS